MMVETIYTLDMDIYILSNFENDTTSYMFESSNNIILCIDPLTC
jgi:hypothetical protein